MESTCKFERMFFKMLKEDNIAGAGGSLGTGSGFDPSKGDIGSSDWYAPGDARIPKVLGKGKVQSRKGPTGGKKKKKKKKKAEEDEEQETYMDDFEAYYLANEGMKLPAAVTKTASAVAGGGKKIVDTGRNVAGKVVDTASGVADIADDAAGGWISGQAHIPKIESIETFEDLRNVIKGIIYKAQHGQLVGKAVETLAGSGIKALEVGKTLADFLKMAAEQPDDAIKTQTGSFIDSLDVDDQLATIIADPIEASFLTYMQKKIENETGDLPPGWNINKELKQFLSTKFAGRTVTGDQE